MKGQRPIGTVRDLIQYLEACPPDAQICLMPEDGEPFPIGGVLEFPSERPPQVWILFDDSEEGTRAMMEWSGGPTDDDEDAAWDTAVQQDTQDLTGPSQPEPEEEDVVEIRGKLRSA